jgi:hypothetical protein
MPKRIEFEGKVHEFPDDFTDADIAAALGGGSDAPAQPTTGATIGADNRGMLGRARDAALNMQGIPGVIAGAASQAFDSVAGLGDMARAGWNMLAPEALEVDRPAQRIEHIPAMNNWQQLGQRGVQAAELAGAVKGATTLAGKVPGVVAKGLGISKVRAAENLTEAATAAKDVPVNMGTVAKEGERYRQLVTAGGRPTGAVTKLLRRLDDGEELTFESARDVYSNLSRLSANEFNSLNPTMQRQIGAMREALQAALTEAAGTVGKGDQYAAGVNEYAKSARAAAKWEELKPAVTKTLRRLAYAGAAGAGYKGFNQ